MNPVKSGPLIPQPNNWNPTTPCLEIAATRVVFSILMGTSLYGKMPFSAQP